MKQLRYIFLLMTLCFISLEAGTVARPLSVGVGFGFPFLVNAQTQVRFAPHWQIGVGYALVPPIGPLAKGFPLPKQSITFDAVGFPTTIESNVKIGLSVLAPFLRFFPTDRNFYLELNWVMFKVTGTVNGDLKAPDGSTLRAGFLSGDVSLTQHMPTLSFGHFFAGELYFINLNMGFTFALLTKSSISLSSASASQLSTDDQAKLNDTISSIQNNIDDSSSKIRSQIGLLPSINITFGFIL